MSEVPMTTELQEQSRELMTLREKQAGYFDAIKSAQTAEERGSLKMQAEEGLRKITDLSTKYEEAMSLAQQEHANREALKSMKSVDRKVGFPDFDSGDNSAQQAQAGARSLGELVTSHPGYTAGLPGIKSAPFNIILDGVDTSDLSNIKTTMTTSAGWAPYGPRVPGYVASAQRIPTLADLIPQANTDSPIFYFMEETTFTNNAAYVAEGATKPESAFALTSRTVQAAKIATTLPVSEEQLEDVPQIREYLDNRGTLQIQLAEEDALLNFTVGSNGWDGFLQKSTVQSHAAAGDPTPTAILKGMVKVQYSPGYAGMATGLAMNPTDWQDVLTLQETTGGYIWTMPSAPTNMPDMRMWGMAVRPTPALTAGTSLLGNFRMFSQIWRRSGLSIRVAYANDDVLKNLVRLIFEERLALQISRGAAFCKVTGLAAGL